MSNFFSKCNMVVLDEITITKGGEDIKLPLLFHIKDIYSIQDTVENNLVFFDDNSTEEDKKQILINLLAKVSLSLMVYDEDLSDYFEEQGLKPVKMKKVPQGYIFTDHESLYNFLVNVKCNENDFVFLQKFIIEKHEVLIERFKMMVDKELETGSDKTLATEAFMSMRIAMEHSHSVIFPENLDKAVSEHSFREYFVKRAYLGRKMEIEDLLRKEAEKKAKQGKRR